jgi:hypothetical protein
LFNNLAERRPNDLFKFRKNVFDFSAGSLKETWLAIFFLRLFRLSKSEDQQKKPSQNDLKPNGA